VPPVRESNVRISFIPAIPKFEEVWESIDIGASGVVVPKPSLPGFVPLAMPVPKKVLIDRKDLPVVVVEKLKALILSSRIVDVASEP